MDLVLDEKIEENQISFDFLKTPETMTEKDDHKWVAENTLVILLRANGKFSADFVLCGKSMLSWVSMATSICKQKIAQEPSEEELLPLVKSLAGDFEYVAVFFSDTPLLQKSTFFDVMEYFSKGHMNVLRLKRGFVFRGEYVKNALMLLSGAIEDFDKQSFMVIDDAKKLSFAHDVLQKRILDYHKQNGVVFLGMSEVDADVEIESGAIIHAFNTIKGETFIGKDAILESGNFIKNTIVCDGAKICQSHLENSKVEKGQSVGPFANLINQKI